MAKKKSDMSVREYLSVALRSAESDQERADINRVIGIHERTLKSKTRQRDARKKARKVARASRKANR